jgi:hypothetical protein
MPTLIDIMTKASAGAYGEESELIGKLAGIFQASQFDKLWGPFICGTMGTKGSDGLHEGYSICPAYGADAQCTVLFTRQKALPTRDMIRNIIAKHQHCHMPCACLENAQQQSDCASLADVIISTFRSAPNLLGR